MIEINFHEIRISNDLYLQQLKDLHSAESQLIKALPKMAKAARNPDLKKAFIEHLEQTKEHLERLKQVAEKLGKRLTGHTCAAMKGLIEEGSEWIAEEAAAEVMDAGIIAAAQRVEHYEMAGYGTVQTFAKLLGEKEAAELFTLTLNEEKAADKKLSLLAKSINCKNPTEEFIWGIATGRSLQRCRNWRFSYELHPVDLEEEPDDWRSYAERLLSELGLPASKCCWSPGHHVAIRKPNSDWN